MPEESFTTDEQKSKYNSGMLQIFRMNNLFTQSHHAALNGDLISYNFILDRIWVELFPDLIKDIIDDDFENKKGKAKKSNPEEEKYNAIQLQIATLNRAYKNKLLSYELYKTKMYQILQKKEIFLRAIQNSLGKGTAYTDGSEDDF